MDIKSADIASAMSGSLSNYISEVIDSIEFERGRKLTGDELDAVGKSVTDVIERCRDKVKI